MYIDVQMQQGCDDSGTFERAFATSLARGEQLGSFFYDQKAMRKHLVEALRSKILLHFQYKRKVVMYQSEALSIHCVFRCQLLKELK